MTISNTQKNLTKKYLSLVLTRNEQYFYFFFKYPMTMYGLFKMKVIAEINLTP